jgi:hypothetical protein
MANADEIATLEAGNDEKRLIIAALKARQAAIVNQESDGRADELKAEGDLLDSQILNELNAVTGAMGATDIGAAKAQLLADVLAQVKETEAADKAALEVAIADANNAAIADQTVDTPVVDTTNTSEEDAAALQAQLDAAVAAITPLPTPTPPESIPAVSTPVATTPETSTDVSTADVPVADVTPETPVEPEVPAEPVADESTTGEVAN